MNANAAKIDPLCGPRLPYSEGIIITHPERICNYDETRIEMDRTKTAISIKMITTSKMDDATKIATKSSKFGSAVCGRLGDG